MKWQDIHCKEVIVTMETIRTVCLAISFPSFSCPAISCHTSWSVLHFHVPIFHVHHFQRPQLSLLQQQCVSVNVSTDLVSFIFKLSLLAASLSINTIQRKRVFLQVCRPCHLSVCLSVWSVSCGKTVDWIWMPFETVGRHGPRMSLQ